MKKRIREKIIKREVAKYMNMFRSEFEGLTVVPIIDPLIGYTNIGNEAGICLHRFVEDGAGDAIEGGIVFNDKGMKGNWSLYFKKVIPHELAHWCHSILFGHDGLEENNNHRESFKDMMKFFLGEYEETPMSFIAPRHLGMPLYRCKCSQMNFDEEMHSKAKDENGNWNYSCDGCGEDLKYVG